MARRITYTPAQIGLMGAKAIRSAYSELKKLATQRQKRLKKGGYADTDLAQKRFINIKGAKLQDIAEELAEVSLFLRDPRSQVSKIRSIERKARKTLKEHGYNIKDLGAFGDLMEMAERHEVKRSIKMDDGRDVTIIDIIGNFRDKAIMLIKDSYRLAKLYEQVERHNISKESFERNFAYFYANLETLIVTPPIERANGAPVTASNLIQKMQRNHWQQATQVYIEEHGEVWGS